MSSIDIGAAEDFPVEEGSNGLRYNVCKPSSLFSMLRVALDSTTLPATVG